MLYFSAFQSHLWNLILARWLEAQAEPGELVPVDLKLGTFPIPRGMEPRRVEALGRTSLPLPSARSPLPQGPLGGVIEGVLDSFHLGWKDLRIKHLKDIFFSKGSRPCLFFPKEVRAETEADALHPGRRALRLRFELPKGSYATILVKRITDAAESGP
jgi:tRNA pseudouridine13 synthase